MAKRSTVRIVMFLGLLAQLTASALAIENPEQERFSLLVSWSKAQNIGQTTAIQEPQVTLRIEVEKVQDEIRVKIIGGSMRGAAVGELDLSKVEGEVVTFRRENEKWIVLTAPGRKRLPELRGVIEIVRDRVLPLVFLELPEEFEAEVGFAWGKEKQDRPDEWHSEARVTRYHIEDQIDETGINLLMVRGNMRDVGIDANHRDVHMRDQQIHLDPKIGRARFAYEVYSSRRNIDPKSRVPSEYIGEITLILEVPLVEGAGEGERGN